MKILFLSPQPFFAPRGTPIAVRAALEALSEQGHQVDMLTYFQGADVTVPNVTINRIARPPFVRNVPIGPSWQKVPCNLYMLLQAHKMLSNGGYDVVHGVEEGAILAWLLRRTSGKPYVFDMDSHMSAQIREKTPLLAPIAWIFSRLEAAALRQSTGVLAVCPALADVARRYQVPERVALLPDMPLNEGHVSEPSEEITELGGVRIVYVGNLQPYQGVDLLLGAFRAIAPRHPTARLVIVGGSKDGIERHAAQVRDLIEEGRVHFIGPRPLEQLGSVLAAADILVSPRTQGVNTPMKIYSYLESGRPVVATRLETHTQVLHDEVACLVEPDPDDLADGVSRLLASSDLRERLGRRGQAFVRREYGRDRFVERLSKFYDRLLE